VLGDISADGGLLVGDRTKDPRRMRWRVILEKKFSSALSQEPEVGVKWMIGWLNVPEKCWFCRAESRALSHGRERLTRRVRLIPVAP